MQIIIHSCLQALAVGIDSRIISLNASNALVSFPSIPVPPLRYLNSWSWVLKSQTLQRWKEQSWLFCLFLEHLHPSSYLLWQALEEACSGYPEICSAGWCQKCLGSCHLSLYCEAWIWVPVVCSLVGLCLCYQLLETDHAVFGVSRDFCLKQTNSIVMTIKALQTARLSSRQAQ